MATEPTPTDAELTECYKAANGEDVGKAQPLTTQRIFRAMRAAIARWGVLRADKIVIPTDTMEQEFQKHYRRGYEAGLRAQPAPAASVLEGPQASTIAEAVRDVGKWLNERPNRPLDLRGVAMLCAYAQAQARAVTLALHQRDSIKANAWRETPLHGYFDADEIIDAVEAAHGITHKEGGQDAD